MLPPIANVLGTKNFTNCYRSIMQEKAKVKCMSTSTSDVWRCRNDCIHLDELDDDVAWVLVPSQTRKHVCVGPGFNLCVYINLYVAPSEL